MGRIVKVAETKDVPPGAAVAVDLEGRAVALFNVDGRFYAIDGTCTHRGGPLSEGELGGTVVTADERWVNALENSPFMHFIRLLGRR